MHLNEINEQEILDKIDQGINLTADECHFLVGNYEVDTGYDDNDRWSRGAGTVIILLGRYFMIDWREGLTEYQENEYWEQVPQEVKKEVFVEEVIKWVPIK